MKRLNFEKNKIYLMGILNVTPDSFSDGGFFLTKDKALKHTEYMIKNGADIIDIGGESTKPYSEPVGLQEEMDRVLPIVEIIKANFDTIISVDTYKSIIADESLKLGIDIINDISGFTFDPEMINIAKRYNPTCIIMHIKGKPKNMQVNPIYDNVVNEVFDFLKKQIENLENNGISHIIIDPGFGFGKTLNDNYSLLKNLSYFINLNKPILAAISRKSMIGNILNNKMDERVNGTVILNTIAINNGAKIIRVHDIKENFELIKLMKMYNQS